MRGSFSLLLTALCCFSFVCAAQADNITVTGTISQNALDTSGGSTDNPSLNNVLDGSSYSVTINLLNGSLDGFGATFSDDANPAGNATENRFQSITIAESSPAGAVVTFSISACLVGYSCFANTGGELDLSFSIASTDLFSSSASATGLGTAPMELLEDSGATDIHGSIDTYSFTAAKNAVPEPSTILLLVSGWIALASRRLKNSF